MGRWRLTLGALGGALVGAALGNVVVGLGSGLEPAAAAIDVLLVAGPGVAVVYGAWALPEVGVEEDLFPRVVCWSFGVMVLMVSVVALATLRPGSTFGRPLGAALTSAAIGAAGGLVIGLFEGRAVTRTREEVRTRRKAEDVRLRNKQLEEIQSIISHDVKGPLGGVYSNIELAQDTGDLEHLDDAIRATERVEELAEDLGTLAREGMTVVDPKPVLLEPLVEELWGALDTPPKARLTVDAEGYEVEADRRRLERMLENLTRNAIDHGGPDVHVHVGTLEAGPGFYVEDDGPGFPEADREKVLEVGYTTDAEGTGFGLSIVTRIARSHGWDVALEESPHGGARIEVHT